MKRLGQELNDFGALEARQESTRTSSARTKFNEDPEASPLATFCAQLRRALRTPKVTAVSKAN